MSAKRSKLFAASTSLIGWGKSGKQYRLTDPAALPKFGTKRKGAEKLQTPNSIEGKFQAPNLQPGQKDRHSKPALFASWLTKLQGLLNGGKGPRNAAIPRFSRQPVQGELSLDNVKVLCNDLSDTDFELVAKPVAPKKAAPMQRCLKLHGTRYPATLLCTRPSSP